MISLEPGIKEHFFLSDANQIQILKFEVCIYVALGSYFINPPQILNLTLDYLLIMMAEMYKMRPNANLCFALAFCSVLSWCLRLTSYVCAVCSLPCSLILPFPPLCSFSLSTLTHQSTNNAPPFVVVICPALVGGSVLGWLYIVLDQFTQIWPSC